MNRVALFAASFVGLLLSAVGAHAADPPGSWPVPYEPAAPRFQQLLSGWYLRGDVGYRFNNVGSIDAPTAVTGTKADTSISGTFGFGYKYQWLRADMTFDIGTPWQVRGTTASPGVQPEYMAKVNPRNILANAYIDMGTWWGLTPYIGAGVGVTQIKDQVFVDNMQVGSRGKSENLAWAAMAGVSYQFSPTWIVDIGYRYLSMGNTSAQPDGAFLTTPPAFNNVTSQEVRLGIRFLLD